MLSAAISSTATESAWKQVVLKQRIKKDISEKEDKPATIKAKVNRCSTCNLLCSGFECKSCFLKRQRECADCKKNFSAVIQDGSIKPRCKDCHTKFIAKNMKSCSVCKKFIQGTLKDGRTVDKCVDCYRAGFNYCPCGSRTYKENKLCSPCYKEQIRIEQEHLEEKTRQEEEKRQAELLLAKIEQEKKSNILDGYFISKCQKCKKKSKGNFKICMKCKEKDV
jgi:hypothetical protein